MKNTQYNQNYILRYEHLSKKLKQKYKGVLFMYSDNKPSVFDELNYIKKERPYNYYRPDAIWYIENMHTRREIILNDLCHKNIITSGMVVGLEGDIDEKDVLHVKSITYPGYISRDQNISKKNYKIMFLSNIRIDKSCNKQKLDAMLYYIQQYTIDDIIVFGDMFVQDYKYFVQLQKIFENYRVTFIPAMNDCTTNLLPQEPFPNRIINEKEKLHKSLQNPCITTINDSNFILSSGEIVKDMMRYLPQEKDNTDNNISDTKTDNCFKIMDTILKCQYLSPTSPDTLKSIVFDNEDTFIIEKPIDYFVNGNCDDFGIRKIHNCVHICLPNFDKTNEIIIFDMKDNSHEVIKFEQ